MLGTETVTIVVQYFLVSCVVPFIISCCRLVHLVIRCCVSHYQVLCISLSSKFVSFLGGGGGLMSSDIGLTY